MKLNHILWCLLLMTGAVGSAYAQGAVDTTRWQGPGSSRRGQGAHTQGAAGSKGGQGAAGVLPAKTAQDPRIQNIRAIFQRISKDTLNEVEAEYDDDFMDSHPSDNGVTLKGYFKKDELLKMIFAGGPSYGWVTYVYYFDKEQPVFVFELEERFPPDKEGGLNHDKLVWGFEGRYYFDKGKLIFKILKGNKFGEIDDEYIKGILNIADDVRFLRKALHRKRPAPVGERA